MVFTLLVCAPRLNAQLWPFSPLFRFGNTVYYKVDSISENKLTGTNLIWDKKLVDRFFDISLINQSIGIEINDSVIYFNQKSRNEPKCYKELLFYSKRNLLNQNYKIKYLKLVESNESELFANATIINRSGDHSDNNNIVKINKSDISGIYLGAGKRTRKIYMITSIVATISAMIIIETN